MTRRCVLLAALFAVLAALPVAAGEAAATAPPAAEQQAALPVGSCTGAAAAAADLPLFVEAPTAAAACSATATCNNGSQLACSDPGGRCSGVDGCYVWCGCEVTWCPNPSGPFGMPCPRPLLCGGTLT